MKAVDTPWMDTGRRRLPGVRRSSAAGRHRRPLHLPRRGAGRARGRTRGRCQRRRAGRRPPATCTRAACTTDLTLTRDGRTTRLFRSEAKYYEPAGAVSWDVAMTATPRRLAGRRQRGRRAGVVGAPTTRSARRGTSRWAIMRRCGSPTGPRRHDPFATDVDATACSPTATCPRTTTTAAGRPALPDPRELLVGARAPARSTIAGLRLRPRRHERRPARPAARRSCAGPARSRSTTATPTTRTIWHTITACKAPCNGSTGIAYPLADGQVQFDSGELGFGRRRRRPRRTATRGRRRRDLTPGTYTYFCRVHPFMRGAFRVKG